MKVVKFLVVSEVSMDEGRVREIESWGEDITPEMHIGSIIKDHVQDKGLLCKLDVIEGSIFNEVKEYAYQVINHKAVEELEKEILESKQCIGGTCED